MYTILEQDPPYKLENVSFKVTKKSFFWHCPSNVLKFWCSLKYTLKAHLINGWSSILVDIEVRFTLTNFELPTCLRKADNLCFSHKGCAENFLQFPNLIQTTGQSKHAQMDIQTYNIFLLMKKGPRSTINFNKIRKQLEFIQIVKV